MTRCVWMNGLHFYIPFYSISVVSGQWVVVVVVLLFYVHGKHLRSCWDGQLT